MVNGTFFTNAMPSAFTSSTLLPSSKAVQTLSPASATCAGPIGKGVWT